MSVPPPWRIAAVTSSLALGGSTTFLLNFQRALAAETGRLEIVSFGENRELASDFAVAGAEVHADVPGELIYEDRLAWGYRALAAGQPRTVIASLGSESFEMLRLAPRGVARIGVVHSDDWQPYTMARQYPAALDAMVGVSPEICAKLRALPEFASTRVVEIPYGIEFRPAPTRPARSPGEPLRILYLGRVMEEQKRISRVLEVVRALEANPGDFRVTIAGSGAEEANVRAALAGSRIAQAIGAVPNARVPELLHEHDVYLLLSDFEGLPLSLLEAMGAGLVPVVSDLPSGIRETVTPAEGIRVPVGDVPAAVEALRALHREPARLEALGRGSMERARREYSARAMVERYVALVASIVPPEGPEPWPAEVPIPAPLGLSAWLYSGVPRQLRRLLKKARICSSGRRRSS